MVRSVLFGLGFVILMPAMGWPAMGGGTPAATVSFADDTVLQEIIRQAMDARPELRQARALIEADRERVPQARALPDPVLALGIQNDGFMGIQIGKMETSWWSIMASQSLPWFGKRDLRARVTESQVRRAESDLARAALTVRAEVERAYLDLLEVRDQIVLLARMEALWSQSEAVARSRYEAGDGVQSDLLRAQLARSRLRQRRLVVQSEEARRLLVMNRLRGKPAAEPLVSPRHLVELADPTLPDLAKAIADAREHSPELRRAFIQHEQAERQIALVQKDSYPDVTVNAAVMPRGGNFETMWQAGVAVTVPVWSTGKRSHAVAEGRARAGAADASADAIACLIEQRVGERHALLTALVESNRIYRLGLLVQSEATVSSTVAQYRVGKVPMASILDAMAGYVADVNGFLQSISQAQRLAIAEREISLADAGGGLPGLSGGAGMAGAAGSAGLQEESGNSGGAAGANAGAAATMSKM
jgi:outer membrane protein, heavy metal efflux system